jgi:hypothetical protein
MLGEYVQDKNEKYATVKLGKRRRLSREKAVVEREVSVKVKRWRWRSAHGGDKPITKKTLGVTW